MEMRLVAPVTRGYVFLSALCEPSVSIRKKYPLELRPVTKYLIESFLKCSFLVYIFLMRLLML